MGALKELFTTPVGLLSLAVIVGVLVIGGDMGRWINQQIERDEARQRR
jgi:hypothetical protein